MRSVLKMIRKYISVKHNTKISQLPVQQLQRSVHTMHFPCTAEQLWWPKKLELPEKRKVCALSSVEFGTGTFDSSSLDDN